VASVIVLEMPEVFGMSGDSTDAVWQIAPFFTRLPKCPSGKKLIPLNHL
jgi:hypothetical protein